MGERRLEAVVIGPGAAGFLKVSLGRDRDRGQFVADVPVDRVPESLRLPNSRFMAVVSGRDFLHVEPDSTDWERIQHKIRTVLMNDWNPIGVPAEVDDEYDSYIGRIYGMLQRKAPDAAVADFLQQLENEWMGIAQSTEPNRLLKIAETLRQLDLPSVAASSTDLGRP